MARDLRFPRAGAWAVMTKPDGSSILGVIARVGLEAIEKVVEPHPTTGEPQTVNKTVYRLDEPFAEFHTVETADGENHGVTTAEFKNVPADQLRQATYAEMLTQRRAGDVTPLYAHRRGYDIGDELRAQIPELEANEALQIERATAISEHPDIRAIDAQRAQELAALDAKYNELYVQAAKTIDPDAEITRKMEERLARRVGATQAAVSQALGRIARPAATFKPAGG